MWPRNYPGLRGSFPAGVRGCPAAGAGGQPGKAGCLPIRPSGGYMTVDADDADGLREVITQQEQLANPVGVV